MSPSGYDKVREHGSISPRQPATLQAGEGRDKKGKEESKGKIAKRKKKKKSVKKRNETKKGMKQDNLVD